MSNTLNYKGYVGSVEFSAEDGVFYGKLTGISDRITFEGDSVESLIQDFHSAVEDYLEDCAAIGKEPEKTYKGTFNVRIPPELHKKLAIYSETHHKTLNTTVAEAIEHYVSP